MDSPVAQSISLTSQVDRLSDIVALLEQKVHGPTPNEQTGDKHPSFHGLVDRIAMNCSKLEKVSEALNI